MVDSIPCSAAPPSTINGIRPFNSSNTCWPVVGLTRPNRFALGAANGRFNALTISRKTGCALIRTATVSNPAVTMSGTTSCFRKIIVNGPGQNFSMSRSAIGDSTIVRVEKQAMIRLCTISGSNRGRSLASKIFATASGLSASAASP